MSDFARIRSMLDISGFADYHAAVHSTAEYACGPSEYEGRRVDALVAGTTIELGIYAANTLAVLVGNSDDTNFLWVDFYTQIGVQDPVQLGTSYADAGGDDTLGDLDAQGTYVTNGAAAGGYVRVTASTVAARDGLYLIQTAAPDLLTLTAADDLAAVVGDDATSILSFERHNRLRVPPLGHVVFHHVVTASDLLVTADTATCSCVVFATAA